MNGIVTTRNVRCYDPKHNPPLEHGFSKSMSREKLSVWIGLCGNGELIGPFFFEGNLNGEDYLQMLNDQIVLAPAERYVYQANGTFLGVWWAQDGAPAHRRIMVMERLQQLLLDRIISRGRDYEWPPRSPDRTPLDFFVWGYLKSKVFHTQSANLADLHQRITMEAAQIPQDMIIRAMRDMRRRAEIYIRNNGGHIGGRSGLRTD